MDADIQKLEAAARMAMGHFETPGNSPVRGRAGVSGLAILLLAVLAVAALAAATIGTL